MLVALCCVSCAEPDPAQQAFAVATSAPVEQAADSCPSAVARSTGSQAVASDDGRCDSGSDGGSVISRHLLEGRYDFGHVDEFDRDIHAPVGEDRTRAAPSRAPSFVQRCGYYLVNKVVLHYCLHPSP